MALRVRAAQWFDLGDSPRGASLALLLALAALGYTAATLLTEPNFTGDAPDYARAVAASRFGVDCQFLEFGHLAWPPLGRAMLDLFVRPRGDEAFEVLSFSVLQQFSRAALVFGFLGVLAAAAWLHLQIRSFRAVACGVVCLVTGKAYLNFSQVGAPYIPGVSALFTGLLLAALEPRRPFARVLCDITAGVCFAVSALFWGTYALALPGAVLAPLVLKRDWRAELPRVLRSATTGVVVLGVVYLLVGHAIGLRSTADYRAWISSSSHGIAAGGFSRAVIGFARSFVDVGDYGRLVKRYLTKDPFNPVSVRDLLSPPLAKIAGFYLATAVLVGVAMLHAIGRRALGLAALMALPVFVFAVSWQGGALERYLPALPALVLVVAAAFQSAEGRPAVRSSLAAGLVIVATTNLLAVSTTDARRADRAAGARLAGTDDVRVDQAVFVVSHWQDDLMTFWHDRPFHELNLKGLSVYALVSPGTAEVPMWRQLAAASMLAAWGEGKRVFVSSRLFAVRPDRAWNWIEADDDRVAWRDLGAFFRTAELAPAALATEFRELVQTERNRRMLKDVVSASVPETSATADTAARLSNYLMAAGGACRVDGTPASSRAAR